MNEPSQPAQRPRWVAPALIVGAILIVVGLALAIDWSGDDEQPVQITDEGSATATEIAPTPIVTVDAPLSEPIRTRYFVTGD